MLHASCALALFIPSLHRNANVRACGVDATLVLIAEELARFISANDHKALALLLQIFHELLVHVRLPLLDGLHLGTIAMECGSRRGFLLMLRQRATLMKLFTSPVAEESITARIAISLEVAGRFPSAALVRTRLARSASQLRFGSQ